MTASSFKIGVQLPEVERLVSWPELFDMARAAEDIGFDALWLGDHLLYDLPDATTRGPWEVWTSLAALAAVTSRVEFGPLVACTSFHAPAMLAKQAATVDAISGGRLILGLGAGWNEREYRAFGFAYDERVARFEEAFAIIRTLLRERRIDFDGRFNRLENCVLDPGPARPGGPPIVLGSIGPRMLRIGLPHVDAWNVWWSQYGNTADGFGEVRAKVEAVCAECGLAPGAVAATAAVYVQLRGGSGRMMGDQRGDAMQPIRGRADEIAAHLAAFAFAGASHIQLVVDPIDQESIEDLGPILETTRSIVASSTSAGS